MKKKYIKINGITDMITFIQAAARVKGDVICRKGKYTIDAKSFMGVASIDISTGVLVEYPETAIEFEDFLTQFVILEFEEGGV